LIVWVIAGLLGLATGLRVGWALVNKQSLVSIAMIMALASLGLVAALSWQPLALFVDRLLHWPNISIGLSRLALIACAAGSCVMITSASSARKPAAVRRVALVQYAIALVIAAVSLALFLTSGQEPEMDPEEYLKENLGSAHASLPWLLPLLYVLLALTLVSWAGMRHSSLSRRGRALFVFTVGIVLLVLASAFFFIRAVGRTQLVGVGAAATLLGCAMLVVAAGSLLPTIEDWFSARQELRTIQPLLNELARRQPDVGIGVRPRGPLAFRVAERMSLISDALYMEAATAEGARRRVDATGFLPESDVELADIAYLPGVELPEVAPLSQARVVAEWIIASREGAGDLKADRIARFPGLGWLRQPEDQSDREWILAISDQYRKLERAESAGRR
jgi:hypothetical protein